MSSDETDLINGVEVWRDGWRAGQPVKKPAPHKGETCPDCGSPIVNGVHQ